MCQNGVFYERADESAKEENFYLHIFVGQPEFSQTESVKGH